MTRHELWAVIMAASADIDRLVAAAVGDLPDSGPPSTAPLRATPPHLETAWRNPRSEPSAGNFPRSARAEVTDLDRERLAGLREAIRMLLATLWGTLGGEAGSERICRALVIHVDERIMRRLPEYLRLGWSLLQTDITGSTTGGRDFFAAVDDALRDPRTPTLVFEVHYYCLSHGFVGMLSTDTVQLNNYKIRLAERIPHPSAPTSSPRAEQGELSAPWPLWSYYALGFLSVVAFAVVLTALSNNVLMELS